VDAVNVTGVGPMAFVTNAWQALGGCGMPNGSVTAYKFVGTGPATTAVEAGTVELTKQIPYAVAADPAGRAYATTNCGPTVETINVVPGDLPSITHGATRTTDAGPDGALFDAARNRLYVTNINASTLTVFDPSSPQRLTTVPLPTVGGKAAKAIDIAFADTRGGRALIATSNGGNDTAGLVDRDIIEACIAALAPSCPQASVFSTFAGVVGGAPEGIAFDPISSRLFVVNKTIGAPALSAIDVIENPDGSLSAGPTPAVIPLGLLGTTASEIPSLIAFDVVVQTR
jgi:DNA-binding beta-propeller fold protein YncE